MQTHKKPDISSNQTIREAIQKIALHGLVNPSTGVVRDTGKAVGYVTKIHTDGDMIGTVDVQEYYSLSMNETEDRKIGYHEGVYLSALQDNSKGVLLVPKLYSEVTVTMDPETKVEYVSMFSHVDIIQLHSHESVTIGVIETDEFDESGEDSPDIHELEETGVYSKTQYAKDSIVSEVQGEESSDKVIHTIDTKKYEVVISEDKSSITADQDSVKLKHDKSELILDDDQALLQFGKSKVKVEDGTVYVGDDGSTDDAVLGVELATILSEMLGYMGQIMTPTMMGPQPPANIASFISLKAKIDAFKSSHSGFLTKKVQIQK